MSSTHQNESRRLVLTSKQRAIISALESKQLHDLRNFSMKMFGSYFMHFVSECKMDVDQANELALRGVSVTLEQVHQEFKEKSEYKQ